MLEIAMLKMLKNEGLISQKEFDDTYTLLLEHCNLNGQSQSKSN